ncbi:DUF3631 domain-containing protein [Streptomyces sp. NPDC048718]|uniref:DUF3631 domain-containing protein n=1 Tax=Streptomyces sp. NPDC048718 TaxID=3365587 RepID=UPI0037117F63
MTTPLRLDALPGLITRLLTDALHPTPAPHPHHQALLQAKEAQTEIDRALRAILDGPTPTTQADIEAELNDVMELLVDKLDTDRELRLLLGDDTCCAGAEPDHEEQTAVAETAPASGDHAGVAPSVLDRCIVSACLSAFDDHGAPDALASADLVAALRTMPGVAEEHWPLAELTQPRLAALLRPYKVSTRDLTLPDGRRRKSYQRAALQAALPDDCGC